nr:CHAT domain-containing protein [Micromonospora sp. DSM 115978]
MHAAGHHDPDDPPAGRSVLDRVVSSYTPTLRALADARTRKQPTRTGRLLLIALPNTPGQRALPAVDGEVETLASLFDPARRTVLADADATRAAILLAIEEHPWVHASCHGTQNLTIPASGGLLPYDWDVSGLVTVADITVAGDSAGEFVFLSACETATSGAANPDVAINLAAALHYAGWRHVVGTL